MKKILALLAIASFLFVPVANASILGIATTGDLQGIQNKIDDIQSQVTALQHQIGDKLGSIVINPTVLTSSSINAALPNPLVLGGVATSTITSDGSNSVIQKLNNVFNLPADFSTRGCFGSSTLTDFGGCIDYVYSLITASSAIVNVPNINVPTANWQTAINIATNQKFIQIQCVPNGTILNWGGVGTSTMWNAGSAASGVGYIAHPTPYGVDGCTFVGPSHSGTTTAVLLGGTQGAEGVSYTHFKIQGFGLGFQFGNNTYSTNISDGQMSDNGQHLVVPAGLTNSTERLNIKNMQFGDAFSSVSSPESNCIVITAASNVNMTDNQYDDCQVVIADGSWDVSIKGGQAENPALVAGTHLGYPYFVINNSLTTSVAIEDIALVNDASSTTSTASEFIQSGAAFTFKNLSAVANGTASTTARLITNISSRSSVAGCGINNVNLTGFTNISDDVTSGQSSCYLHLPATIGKGADGILITSTSTNFLAGITMDAGAQSGIIRWRDGKSTKWELGNDGANGDALRIQTSSGNFTGTSWLWIDRTTGKTGLGVSGTPSTTLQVVDSINNSSTLRIGTINKFGCVEMYDAVASGTLTYMYVSSTALVVTASKPNFCQ